MKMRFAKAAETASANGLKWIESTVLPFLNFTFSLLFL